MSKQFDERREETIRKCFPEVPTDDLQTREQGLSNDAPQRWIASEFLDALGFPQLVALVSGNLALKDAKGELALAVLARHDAALLTRISALEEALRPFKDAGEYLASETIGHEPDDDLWLTVLDGQGKMHGLMKLTYGDFARATLDGAGEKG